MECRGYQRSEQFNGRKAHNSRGNNTDRENDIQRVRTKNHDWTNIYIKDTRDQEKGKVALSGIHMVKKGTIVCYYHGNQVVCDLVGWLIDC